jgi:hypothetical protein
VLVILAGVEHSLVFDFNAVMELEQATGVDTLNDADAWIKLFGIVPHPDDEEKSLDEVRQEEPSGAAVGGAAAREHGRIGLEADHAHAEQRPAACCGSVRTRPRLTWRP